MLSLSAPQNIFLNGLKTKYRAYVGGFGSGKTFVGCLDLLIFAAKHPQTTQGYFGTSYPAIRDIFYPTISEAAELMGFTVKILASDKEVNLFRNGRWYGTIICRSMDNPDSIVGFKIARALVDEIDTLPKDKATKAWNKIVARMRLVIQGVENSIGVTTTPEGFLFVYSRFKENPTESYSMVQASTYENADYLPPDYIKTLIETYPQELIGAYIRGQFVNLKSGTVYRNYNRVANGSDETIQDREHLYIGMDFNVEKMAATVYVKRPSGWHAVAELSNLLDTPAMCDAIKARWPDHRVTVYPDASGKNRTTKGAATSDIQIIKNSGFSVLAHDSNPAVKDRINATNKAFESKKVWVNAKLCPTTARCLEQQSYNDAGEPDKKSGHDHQNDATTYPIAFEMPILKPYTQGAKVRMF